MHKFWHVLREKCSVGDIQSLFNDEGLAPTSKGGGAGATALQTLAEYVDDNALDILKLLVENGAVIDANDDTGRTPLMLFAKCSSRLDCISYLLDAGADVKCVDSNHKTALHYCSENRQQCSADILKLLITHGLEINAKDINGRTPLMLFLRHGCNIETVQILLDAGADTSWTCASGFNVLHHYFDLDKKVNIDIVKVLLYRGVDINANGDAMQTPLMNLLNFCDNKYLLETVKALINCGANVMCADEARRNLLFYCTIETSRMNLYEIVNFLVACGVDVNCKDSVGRTPLMHFVTSQFNLNLIKVLIEAGADAHCVDNTGNTVLHACASYYPSDIKDFFKYFVIDQGVNINARDSFGHTPLMHFLYSEYCNANIVELLLDLGTDVQVNAYRVGSLLHIYPNCETESETINIIKLFLGRGVDINSKDSFGNTPLSRFIERSCPLNILKFMLDAGADVDTIDIESRNLLHKCAYYGADPGVEVVKLLLSTNVDINQRCSLHQRTPLLEMVSRTPCDQIIDTLICAGADPNTVDSKLRNALHLIEDACGGGHCEATVKTLIKHGTSLNAIDCNGNTPLFFKVLNCDPSQNILIRQLLENGADPNYRNDCYQNVLHLCPVSNPDFDGSVLLDLIDFGIDVNATDCRGRTPLMEFIKHSDNIRAMEILILNGASVACKDVWNNTALHICCDRTLLLTNPFKTYKGMLAIITLIANNGGDGYALDSNMRTPLGSLVSVKCFRSVLRKCLPCIEELLKYMLIRDCGVWEYYISGLPEYDAQVIRLRYKMIRYTSELSIMKTSFIKDNVSLYDLCKTNAKHKLLLYLKDSKLMYVDYVLLLVTQFPLYFNLINYKFDKARLRAHLLSDLDELDANVISLNHDCLEVIASFLDDTALNYFIIAMK